VGCALTAELIVRSQLVSPNNAIANPINHFLEVELSITIGFSVIKGSLEFVITSLANNNSISDGGVFLDFLTFV
jgi:hypothetical protein